MHHRRCKRFAAGSVLAITLALASVSPAWAAIVVTVTARGVVAVGGDDRGDFTGTAGASLVGRSVTLVQTMEVTSSTDLSQADNADASFAFFDKVSTAISLDGGPVAGFDSASSAFSGGLYAVSTLDALAPRPASVDSQQSWVLLNGDALQAQILVSSALDAFVGTAALFQNFSFGSAPADGLMQMGADLSYVDAFDNTYSAWHFYVEQLDSLDVVVTRSTSLPEPTPLALLAVGLAVMTLLQRRTAWPAGRGH
jgi:hypothetical protein